MPFNLLIIGQILTYTREEKGLTRDEVSTLLLIKNRGIEAIEIDGDVR